MNIRFFSEDGDGTLLPMLPQQAITPAGKETAPVEEAYSFSLWRYQSPAH